MKLVKESTFKVNGISCQGCVSSIQAALRRLDGVSDVQVNLAASEVQVGHDILQVDQQALIDAIESAGYSTVRAVDPE
jgi:copper chaperone